MLFHLLIFFFILDTGLLLLRVGLARALGRAVPVRSVCVYPKGISFSSNEATEGVSDVTEGVRDWSFVLALLKAKSLTVPMSFSVRLRRLLLPQLLPRLLRRLLPRLGRERRLLVVLRLVD